MRSGFRDYDPAASRFTAPDPIGYTGGDYDLWDYCVDDPVSKNGPSGLFRDRANLRSLSKAPGHMKRQPGERSVGERLAGELVPFWFGNDEEKRQAKESLARSLRKSLGETITGFLDVAHVATDFPIPLYWPYVTTFYGDHLSPKEQDWKKTNEAAKRRMESLEKK